MPAAKKRDVRRSVQQTAWVTLEGGFATRRCVVHDMSATGAKLSVSDSSVLEIGRSAKLSGWGPSTPGTVAGAVILTLVMPT